MGSNGYHPQPAFPSRPPLRLPSLSLFLRFLVCLLSLSGLLLLLLDHQSVLQLAGGQYISQEAKFSYSSGIQYLAFCNGLVAVYCISAALLSIPSLLSGNPTGKLGAWITFLLDQGLAYVLLAAASAASEVAYLAEYGDAKTTWPDICSTFGRFCRLLRASLVVSFLAVLVLAVISAFSARHLFRRYHRQASARKGVSET